MPRFQRVWSAALSAFFCRGVGGVIHAPSIVAARALLRSKNGILQSQQDDGVPLFILFDEDKKINLMHYRNDCTTMHDCGKVELGERMALQVFAATEATEPSGCGWKRDLVHQESRVDRAEKGLHSIASAAESKRASKHDAVCSGVPCEGREVRHVCFPYASRTLRLLNKHRTNLYTIR